MDYRIHTRAWRTCAAAVVALVAAIALGACSTKKNNAATRRYQEFITRYNIYYNGDVHMTETLADMEGKYEDDYSRLVKMHPVEAKADQTAPQPSGDFNRSIEKAQKAIQLRSIKKKPAKKTGKAADAKYKEWMKRDEYNPFLHNAWMMMGRGQYYNGDFLGAASTFFYISRHFTWLPRTVTEAKLMQALCYIALGWQFEAEMILTRIKTDDLTTNELRRLYNFAYADYYIHDGNYADATPFLRTAVEQARGSQKTRLSFLLGQILQRQGDKKGAYEAYKRAGSASSATYRTKFNARIKQSEVYEGSDIEPEVKALRRMTRYDRNKEYLDQIYYAIGNLYLSRADTLHAIENYELANEKSTRNGIDKALNQLRLGSLYFDLRNYAKAQPAYAEAVPLLPASHPGYADIKRRSDVLDELAIYSENVILQDSLLRLAAMTPEQQRAVIDRIIAELKEKEKKEAEEAAREEYLANRDAGNTLQDQNTQQFNINSDNSWYFYNTATKNAGRTEFQKRWGSRKLEDDWRRRNKSSFNAEDFEVKTDETDETETSDTEKTADTGAAPDAEASEHASDPHYPEYYLAQIPTTDEAKTNAHNVIQEGLYNMGVILKDKLEDYDAAYAQLHRLLEDYPDNIYRLDTYYNLYLMYMRMGRKDLAEKYRALILSDFADSKYGIAMQDPNYLDNLRDMDRAQEALYEATYEAYLDGRTDEVHSAAEQAADKYSLGKTMPKFMFLDALAYVAERNPEQFREVLRTLLERYPDTDITPVASSWLKDIAKGRELRTAETGGLVRGMIWDLKLSNDTTDVGGTAAPAEFELDPGSRQLIVFTFPTDQVSTNEVLYRIARHNFQSFVVRDYDLEPMSFGRLGMVIVRDFDGLPELKHYLSVMQASDDLDLPEQVRPIIISDANFRLLIDEGRSFEEYFDYLREEQAEEIASIALMTAKTDEPDAPAQPEETEVTEITAAEEPAIPSATADEPEDNKVTNGAEDTRSESEPPAAAPVPARQPAQQPQPIAPAQSQPAAKPQPVPLLPPGSEGDDPLLDD